VATDTVSLDYGLSTTFPAHHFFLQKNVWGIENMANVEKLRPKGDVIFAVPHNIHDGSGSPTRAFALPEDVFQAFHGSGHGHVGHAHLGEAKPEGRGNKASPPASSALALLLPPAVLLSTLL